MTYRKTIETTAALAAYYDQKYRDMGGCWVTPAEECNQHLDDLGVPHEGGFPKSQKWLLDIGCGGGYFLREAMRRVRCVALEISVVATLEASRRGADEEPYYGQPELYRISNWPIDGNLDDEPNFILGPYAPPRRSGFDYIVSLGSLEHVIDLDRALDNIRELLKPDGQWYFFCPNELWVHQDQPNERTATDAEWVILFAEHGLKTEHKKRWNDSTAFWGGK